jgi:protein-S-isoprenylcysteine O-methyltransferase Ste14
MKRWAFLLYGIFNHVFFLAVFAYMAAFVGAFSFAPKTIDTVVGATPVAAAVLINLGLMALFAVQHSVMARPAFKTHWTRLVPRPIERSTYVLLSNLVVILLMWQWRGIDAVVWDFQNPVVRGVLWALFAAGWLLIPLVSLMINHFDLFGTRQVWLHFQGRDYEPLPFRTPLLYSRIRHPLYVGWMTAFWVTPTMTAGHFLFASVLTGYMIAAAVVEERDLVAHFGDKYVDYRRRVPMFIPWRGAKGDAPRPQPAEVRSGP